MKYLSIDLEATGLDQHCHIIEFAMIPFDTKTKTFAEELSYTTYIRCPSFEDLRPTLNQWVIDNNQKLIEKAHSQGITLSDFAEKIKSLLTSKDYQEYFDKRPIVLFGKSMNAIDLPFLNRDLGWDFMRTYFSHRQLDFSSVCYYAIDREILAPGEESGSALMKRFGMGEVAHTALADAVNTAKMYLNLLDLT